MSDKKPWYEYNFIFTYLHGNPKTKEKLLKDRDKKRHACGFRLADESLCENEFINERGFCERHTRLNCVCCGESANKVCGAEYLIGATINEKLPLCNEPLCYRHDKCPKHGGLEYPEELVLYKEDLQRLQVYMSPHTDAWGYLLNCIMQQQHKEELK